jgi:hypothetical protein
MDGFVGWSPVTTSEFPQNPIIKMQLRARHRIRNPRKDSQNRQSLRPLTFPSPRLIAAWPQDVGGDHEAGVETGKFGPHQRRAGGVMFNCEALFRPEPSSGSKPEWRQSPVVVGPDLLSRLLGSRRSQQQTPLAAESLFAPGTMRKRPQHGFECKSALVRFFARTARPFFLLTGAGTALIALYAVVPSWVMPKVAKLPYLQDYTIIIQHWGIMVGLMGVAMTAAAVVPEWRVPIFLYSAVEKAFMVWLVLSNARQPFVNGFWVPCVIDATVVLYTIGYFSDVGFQPRPLDRSAKPDQ